MKCRHCNKELTHVFVDLGSSPPSNSYLNKEAIAASEKWYPLKVVVCDRCWLVQTEDFVDESDMFDDDYAYFSSYSSSWLKHAEMYVEYMKSRFDLTEKSMAVEVAANDGYLLQYVQKSLIPCYGIEPTRSTALIARRKGIEIVEEFFGEEKGRELASQGRQADLIVANNVLAHVPDINDFVKGFLKLLKPTGVATFEFPHLLNLVKNRQFDTIYHEHYSYLSLTAVQSIFDTNGLVVFDVDELLTHGGSLRVYAQRSDTGRQVISRSVQEIKDREIESGVTTIEFYREFQQEAEKIKDNFLGFLLQAKKNGKVVAAYGAAAKGNTLMNFSGIRTDLINYVVDKNPAKQGKYMPGSRIPIVDESALLKNKPDYVVILPWNLKDEIVAQHSVIHTWGGKFVVFIPNLELIQ